MMYIETERLVLRNWREDEITWMEELRGDPAVMHHFAGTDTPQRVREYFPIILRMQEELGYVFCPVIEKASNEFCGFCGIQPVRFTAPFTPATEIGWSFHQRHWGKGYATEAARAWLNHAFRALEFDEIVAFAVTGNIKSHQVMERLGMRRDQKRDFDHPNISDEYSHLRRHWFWSITRSDWHDRILAV